MAREYYAVFRMVGSPQGVATEFQAEGVTEAIKKLIDNAAVSSTTAFAEFEVYEVVGPRKYVVVASKSEKPHGKLRGPGEYTVDEEKKPSTSAAVSKAEQPKPYKMFQVNTL